MWDKAREQTVKYMKFQCLWKGPYQIVDKIGQGTYRLRMMQGD